VQPTDLGIFKRIGPDTPTWEFRINESTTYWRHDLAERAAMMTNVFSPDNRNVRMMKDWLSQPGERRHACGHEVPGPC
jgi:hypothetical protein